MTGVDDHSRFCVMAAVVRAMGRAVCLAFAQALRRYGIPEEVLTDNGKQFTPTPIINRPHAHERLVTAWAAQLTGRSLQPPGCCASLTRPPAAALTLILYRPCGRIDKGRPPPAPHPTRRPSSPRTRPSVEHTALLH